MANEIGKTIKQIRKLDKKLSKFIEKNEDLCGYDDATWFDTIAYYNEQIAGLGVHLADLVEKKGEQQ